MLYQGIADFRQTLVGCLVIIPGILALPICTIFAKKFSNRLFILFLFIRSLFFVYLGMQTYKYYFLFLMPFGIFGLILLGKLGEGFSAQLKNNFSGTMNQQLLWPCICLFLLILSYNTSFKQSKLYTNNPTIANKKGEEPKAAPDLFAEYMRGAYENPTLLNYQFLDGSFYLAADILPTERFFEFQNINPTKFPDNYYAQMDSILNQKTDFVVLETATDTKEEDIEELIKENYQRVMTHNQYCDERDRTYWLYEKK
ncbi:hypothetical protein [Enterococcus rotai]|uniref:hypothetical protein n=1 Tax=Enterococcus rotai TaxID=118060 RepID=UPI0035C6F68E